MFSAPLKSAPDDDGVNPAEVQRYFVRHGRYTAGTVTRYASSTLTGEATHALLAKDLTIGARFHSAPVICLADAKPVHLGHVAQADGRWRLYVFAGAEDPAAPASCLRALCDFLRGFPDVAGRRYTPAGADIDSVIDVRVVFQQGHHELALEALPAFLLPRKGRLGLRDYEKMFCADLKNGSAFSDMSGIDREHGCVVVVRPDQYIAHILRSMRQLADFFDGFML